MNPEATAISDPYRWTCIAKDAKSWTVRHPNGVELRIRRLHGFWHICRLRVLATGNRDLSLIEIPRKSWVPGLRGCILDLAPRVDLRRRALLEQVVLDIRLWCLIQPNPAAIVLLERQKGTVVVEPGKTRIRLPDSLRARLDALKDVFLLDASDMSLYNPDGVRLHMPTTLHEVLALRAQKDRAP